MKPWLFILAAVAAAILAALVTVSLMDRAPACITDTQNCEARQ